MSQDSIPAFFDEVKLVAEVSDSLAVFIATARKLYSKIPAPVEGKIETPNGGLLSGDKPEDGNCPQDR